jgi:hypothetical protein
MILLLLLLFKTPPFKFPPEGGKNPAVLYEFG